MTSPTTWSRPLRAVRESVTALVLVSICAVQFGGCDEEFDPATLVNELRMLGISSEPADLIPGESALLEALVVGVDESEISYAWEWCPFTEGPNSGYACPDPAQLGLTQEMANLLDLGDQSSAVLFYPGDPTMLREMCEAIVSEGDSLPDFIALPDCENGVEITIRLTVSAGSVEKIAIKKVFVWFDPVEDAVRNHNPLIDEVEAAGLSLNPDEPTNSAAGETVIWNVIVDLDTVEDYVPRSGSDRSSRTEEILFSWFSTGGEWDREHSFSDGINFTLEQAGLNELTLSDVTDSVVDVFVVIRDGRGGSSWEMREIVLSQ